MNPRLSSESPPKHVSLYHDLKTAAVLAGGAAVLGAVTVPLLLPSVIELVPPDQRVLPLPLPLFSIAIAVQFLIVYGLFALAGLRLARAGGLEPAPFLTSSWTGIRRKHSPFRIAASLTTGLLCGVVLVLLVTLIKYFLPETLPRVLHPASLLGALSASATASFAEEILCRLFLLSALLRLLRPSTASKVIAIAASSILFGLLHAPAAIFLFGGFYSVPPVTWLWVILLNGLVGVACAAWYLRAGIGTAILVHFGTDLVWHVVSQLF